MLSVEVDCGEVDDLTSPIPMDMISQPIWVSTCARYAVQLAVSMTVEGVMDHRTTYARVQCVLYTLRNEYQLYFKATVDNKDI